MDHRNRYANRDGVIIFPGTDVRREVELKRFLARPIDSRDSVSDPVHDGPGMSVMLRSSEPTEAVKRECDSRLERVRARSRMAMRPHLARGVPRPRKHPKHLEPIQFTDG
jgi:hypothetical protein